MSGSTRAAVGEVALGQRLAAGERDLEVGDLVADDVALDDRGCRRVTVCNVYRSPFERTLSQEPELAPALSRVLFFQSLSDPHREVGDEVPGLAEAPLLPLCSPCSLNTNPPPSLWPSPPGHQRGRRRHRPRGDHIVPRHRR